MSRLDCTPAGRIARTLALIVMLAVAGCSLNPRPDPTRFYVLSSLADMGEGSEAGPSAGELRLGVGPISLPPYLSRSQLVTRVTPNRVTQSEFERWAEPLRDEVPRVLGDNLSLLLGAGRVLRHPWYASERVDLQVVVELIRFERDPAGTARLDARWSLYDAEGVKLAEGRSRVEELAASPAPEDAVAAQSRALATLSREIARAARRGPGDR